MNSSRPKFQFRTEDEFIKYMEEKEEQLK